MSDTVHEYYAQQGVLPTYGKFMTPDEMAEFDRQRERLFTDRLYLPRKMFSGARMIEFGPDSGENALVFARWGAECTLVEPNPKSHPVIRQYFQSYNPPGRLADLKAVDILKFGSESAEASKYDLIDAEYSIYTVRPIKAWIDVIAQILKPNGFFIFFYMESFGSFLELFLKVIHYRMRQLTGRSGADIASSYLRAKWDSIPHKRTLEAFVMDVLENPFTRLEYLIEPQTLCSAMNDAGLDLYSAWPPYRDGLSVDWVKKIQTPQEILEEERRFIASSRLSYLVGTKCFLLAPDAAFEKVLWDLTSDTDALIDNFDPAKAEDCRQRLAIVLTKLDNGIVTADAASVAAVRDIIKSVQHLLALLVKGSPDEIAAFCNADEAFIKHWGSPAHATVFRRR